MNFRFENKITVWDVWKLSMDRIYRSTFGICAIMFTVAIFALTVIIWNPKHMFWMGVLVFFCILFPVLQPILIYFRAAKVVRALPGDMIYEINDTGVHITANNQKNHVMWKNVHRVMVEPNVITIVAEGGRGYMLTNTTLGTQRDAFIKFIESKRER